MSYKEYKKNDNNDLSLDKIMIKSIGEEDRTDLWIFNKDYPLIESVKTIAFKNDMEIIDIEYTLLNQALTFLQEHLDNGMELNEVEEYDFFNQCDEPYTTNLLDWAKQTKGTYCDDALDELGNFDTMFSLLTEGYQIHQRKIMGIAISIAEDVLETRDAHDRRDNEERKAI